VGNDDRMNKKQNRWLMAVAASLVLAAAPAQAATCTLSGPTTWSLGASGVWGTAGNWTPATVPNSSSTNVCIVDGASTVSMNGSFSVGDLQLAGGNTLAVGGNTLNVGGTSILNAGAVTIGNGNLTLGNNVTLSGGGTITTTSDVFINQASGGLTLTNVDNTIQGTGQYGQNGLSITNQSGGTINALGGTLTMNGGGLITNAGLLGAVNTGTLEIDNTVNNAGGNITANAGTVSVNSTINGGTLNSISGGTLTSGTATLNGVTISAGSTYNVGGQTFLEGTITNNGTITVPNNTLTVAGGDVTLTGGGTVTMSSDAFFNQSSGGLVLNNVNNTIEGTGQLGQNGMALNNGGTVNANVTSGTLSLNGGGAVTNTGLLEATNGGILSITNNVTNTGANITADGGTVSVNATITGGTLNQVGTGVLTSGSATLNGVTISAGSTYNVGGQTFLEGTITNNGTITVPNTTLTISGGTGVTLTGGGTVIMSNDAFFNQASGGLTLDNVNNTIEGTGQLGQNGMAFINESGGTVNANINGGTLSLNGSGLVTNAGLLEATNSGTLEITNNVINTGGNITANGGTVLITGGATITGGTLNQTGTGVLTSGTATLNGVTISTGSTYNVGGQTFLEGTITNNGTITNPNNTLTIAGGDVTLTGGGTVSMTSDAFFNQASSGLTLNNVNNTIKGTGQLGQNGMALNNESGGTVNATGGTLSLNGGGLVTNAGLLEATTTGTLNISNTVNNSGNITANGGIVNISSTINGGTLNTLNGGTMNGNGAVLNGVTLSTASTLNDSGQVFLEGTITNKGTITVPNNTLTVAGGPVTLTGGGTVTMSSDAFFNQSSGGLVLNNVNNTIEGTGQLGQNGLTINNGGTILANVNGGILNVNGGGTLTNTGTLKAANGGTLLVSTPFSSADFASNTLQGGGSYVVNGTAAHSILQIDSLGTTGGEIHTLGANTTITLDGTNANVSFVDQNGNNALSSLSTNNGTLNLEGGYSLTSPGQFNNSGEVLIDSASSLATGGDNDYVQTAGITQVDGTLTAPLVSIGGGVLEGDGTVNASSGVTIASGAAIQAGDTLTAPVDPPGTLNITGPLDISGTVNETISGPALADISLLNVTGNVNLGSSGAGVDVMLLNGFDPTTASQFVFLTYTGTLNQQAFSVTDPHVDPFGTFGIGYGANDAYLTFTPNPPITTATPEPAVFLPLAGLLASLAYGMRRRKQGRQSV
jgi:fibronectin-binding autotransporter adhesin